VSAYIIFFYIALRVIHDEKPAVSDVHPKNLWLVELMDEWNTAPLCYLPRAKDGLAVIKSLVQYPTEIPRYERNVPFESVCKGQRPTLSHVMEDLLLLDDDKLRVTDAGQRHISEGGLTKAQLLANMLQAPYVREASSTTRLYSVLDLHFQKGGSHKCGLVIPPEVRNGGLEDRDEDGLCWGTSVCPGGNLTDIHYDYHGSAQLIVGISTQKLWLIWPPTPRNLDWWSGFRSRTPTGTETLEAVKNLDGLNVLYQTGSNAFVLPSYHLHAVITFEISAHSGVTFWDMDTWNDFSRGGLEWEYNWAKDYASKGYGLVDAQTLEKDIVEALNNYEVLGRKRNVKGKDLQRWVADMRRKVSGLRLHG
jgi:hypothetical protein